VHTSRLCADSLLRYQSFQNGGVHSGNTLAPQEFMVAPVGAKSFSQAMQMNSEIYHCLKELIIEQSGKASTGLGDEGGFAPPLTTFEQALGLLESATSKAGYTSGHSNDVVFGVDPASVEFYNSKDKTYNLGFKMGNDDKSQQKGLIKTGTEMHEIYTSLLAEYPIALLEDPFAEDDFDSWRDFCSTVDAKVELVGDDLLATNPKRIQMAAKEKLCNSLLLKINQIGTITEAIESANLAMSHGWAVFVRRDGG
jgi:enolase